MTMTKFQQKMKTLASMLWGNKFTFLQILRYALGQLLAYSGIGKFVVFRTKYYRLRLTASPVAMVLFRDPGEQRDEEGIASQLLKSGDTVVDIGANIGTFTMCASVLVGESGRVISIEAHPKTARIAASNIKLNNLINCELLTVALGEKRGKIGFSDGVYDDVNRVDEKSSLVVDIVPLDELCVFADVKRIDLVKIDVEGYELFVLKGGERFFSKVDAVLFEASSLNCEEFGYKIADLFDWFKFHGFVVVAPQDMSPVSVSALKGDRLYNLIAIRKERLGGYAC